MEEIKVHPECIPCFFRQVVIALQGLPLTEHERLQVMRDCLSYTATLDLGRTPAHATTFLHRRVRELLGFDPFAERKRHYNELAMRLYPHLKEMVEGADDPLRAAFRVAIAGNVIDLGIYTEIDVEAELQRALSMEMPYEEYEELKNALERSEEVLYLLDNSGEIVFDRVLIELLQARGNTVTAAVKAGPIINDATMEDAVQVGLTEICRVVDNGSDGVGTILEWCSDEFRRLFYETPVVISKGQGNFETLFSENIREKENDLFFLFQVKCDVVSRYSSIKKGERVLVSSHTLAGLKTI